MSFLSSLLAPAWIKLAYRKEGPLRIAAPLLAPLSLFYGFILILRRLFYRIGLFHSKSHPIPIISVGNITVGGVGKTPVTLFLAHHLSRMGFKPAILLRGYGRKSNNPIVLHRENFIKPHVQQYGDEPALLAFLSDFPIGICSNRSQGVEKLGAETDCNIIILDDGFQHIRLKRNLDLVVLDGSNPYGNGYCLPYGPLREPTNALNKANALIINGEMNPDNYSAIQRFDKTIYEGGLEWIGLYPLESWMKQGGGIPSSIERHRDQPVIIASGIGSPQRLKNQAESYGLIIKDFISYPDHYWFNKNDLRFLEIKARQHPILITEKDAIRFFTHQDISRKLLDNTFVIHAAWKMNQSSRFEHWLDSKIEQILKDQLDPPVESIPASE